MAATITEKSLDLCLALSPYAERYLLHLHAGVTGQTSSCVTSMAVVPFLLSPAGAAADDNNKHRQTHKPKYCMSVNGTIHLICMYVCMCAGSENEINNNNNRQQRTIHIHCCCYLWFRFV